MMRFLFLSYYLVFAAARRAKKQCWSASSASAQPVKVSRRLHACWTAYMVDDDDDSRFVELRIL